MVFILVDHKVKDYAKWKSFFDDHSVTRKKSGSKGGQLYRVSGEPNHICILLEFDTIDNAKKFYESDDLKKVMQEAGVIGKPDVWFLDKVGDISA